MSPNGRNFGKGEIEGVVAPETAAHAAGTAALLPMLSLGVPGSPTAAVLLGGLLIWGLQPGPMLFVEQKEFVWGLIASMYLGNLVGLIIVLTCVPLLAAILRIPFSIIAPIILVLCAIGAYSVHNSTFDVILMLVFGVLGYVLKKCNYPLAPLVLAIVLGDKAEEAFRQSLLSSQGNLGIFFSNGLVVHDHGPRTDRAVLVADSGGLYPAARRSRPDRPATADDGDRTDAGFADGSAKPVLLEIWPGILYARPQSRVAIMNADMTKVLSEKPARRKPVACARADSEAHAACHRADRHLVQLQEQGLCGAEECHRVDGHLSQPQRHPARRTPARAGFRHQPHAGARSDGAARARRLRALGAAPRRLYRAQDQERGDRADHRLGGAGKHGGAPDHRERAEHDEIASLRKMFATFEDGQLRAHLDEYSEVNIEFHQSIIRMSGNSVLIDLAENLFTHMRMIRSKTIVEKDRVDRSIRDHMNIIEALEARDTERAEMLVRDHALGLADHVAKYADYLD